MSLYFVLSAGLVLSVLLSALILGTLVWNYRLWSHHAPEEMAEFIPPLNDREKVHRYWVALVFFILMFGVPIAGIKLFQAKTGGSLGYWELFLFLWGVWMTFNIVDLMILDWLIVVKLWPQVFYPPEVNHLLHLNSYKFHFIAFCKGTVGLTVASFPFAGLFLFL